MAQPLIAALLQDALAEFRRAVEHIPAPGRHRRLGVLNAPAWAVAHLASSVDAWVNELSRGRPLERWLEEWHRAQRAAARGTAVPTDLDEACAHFEEVVASVMPYLEQVDEPALSTEAAGLRASRWEGRTAGYLVARSVAHTFVHAGELTVVASLAGAGDLGLPGERPCSTEAAKQPQTPEELRRSVALALDARHEVERVALALPRAAHGLTFGPRLKGGANLLAHVALTEDNGWNRAAQRLDPDPWLDRLGLEDIEPGDPEPPLDFDDALAAFRRVCERSHAHLEGQRDGGNATWALPWTAAHLFAHAGEMAAIGSLTGMADLDLPAATPHLAELHASR